MSVNNVHNYAAIPWPKNTILIIVGGSMINVTNEKQALNRLKSDVLVAPR